MCECRSPRRSSSRTSSGSVPAAAASSSPRPSTQLRRDPGQAEPLVDALLGRAARRLARRVVEDPVLRDVQPALHGRLAQRHVVVLGAGEVLQHVAELVGGDALEVDRQAGVEHHPRARVARALDGLHERVPGERGDHRGHVGRRGDHVEVLDRVGAAAQRAGGLDPVGARRRAQRVDDLLGERLRAREQEARRRLAVVAGRELLEQLLLGLRAEPAQPPQLLALGRAAQRLERVDAQLVVEAPRALRPEAGQVHHRDHAARELRAQLRRLLGIARVDERLELVLERLADPRQLGHAAVAHELLDGHGGLAHRPGGCAVREDAIGHRAVELVQVGELLERGGDLGVRHSPSLRGRGCAAPPGSSCPPTARPRTSSGWSPPCARTRRPTRACWSSTTPRPTAPA